ncbi:MAG: ATP-dependent DNA helicase RecG [Desulfuromonadales bacterium]|nr:ATP-dependent DNA helicase RecG [Desulfuromonadales bacterium]
MTKVSADQSRQPLSTPVAHLKGVGPRLAEKLAKLNIHTVEDLLYTLPHRYEDRREFRKIAHLRDSVHEVFFGEILACGEATTSRSRRKLFEVVVSDGTGQIVLKWFHYRKDWMNKRFVVGQRAVFTGEVKRYGAIREVHHPDVEFLAPDQSLADYQSSDPLAFGRILPVYPLTEGLTQYAARKIWKQAVDLFVRYVPSCLPDFLVKKHGLLPLADALLQIHWPSNEVHIEQLEAGRTPALHSLVYDEFFFLELGLALKRRGIVMEPGITFTVNHKYTKPLAALLPYRLTAAQRRVLGEIKHDLMSAHPMNRLIQGDVGCGKTIVAMMTALVAIENDTQVAVVAPTEILAEQHYLQFHGWLEQLGLQAALLRGKMPVAEKRQVLEELRAGQVNLVVGTHAVLQEGVEFRKLGLGIIDEQHRFGVRQRAVLREKGTHPHILVMTATPIPRTLSLTVYGDLALSVIDEMPPGRTPVETIVASDAQRGRVYTRVRQEIDKGHQAYIVYPLVEESEKSDLLAATEGAEKLKNDIFPQARLGLLHGRMKPAEKEEIMTRFKNREIDILVATTVIEVGIDVPNATVMLVEHAERFGLAQLHQLRGRVGRGEAGSICILLKSYKCSEDGEKRLEVMRSTNDGFRIAEADLEIRGPGEFLGTRQSGLPDFRVANILRDGRILENARQDAFAYAESLEFRESKQIRSVLKERWGNRLELASIG